MNTEENEYIDLLIPDDFKELDRFLDENGYEHGYDEAYDTFLIGSGDGFMYTVECTYDDSNPYYALYRGDECVFEPNFLERLKNYILETIPSSTDKEEDGYEYDSVYGKDVNEALDILKTAGYIVEAGKKYVESIKDNLKKEHDGLSESVISESVNIPPYYIELARKILEDEEHWTQATDEEVKEWLDDEYDGGRKGKIFWKAYCDAFKHEEDDYKCVRLALDAVFDDEENMLMRAEVGVL